MPVESETRRATVPNFTLVPVDEAADIKAEVSHLPQMRARCSRCLRPLARNPLKGQHSGLCKRCSHLGNTCAADWRASQ
jgi:hypothetical protein